MSAVSTVRGLVQYRVSAVSTIRGLVQYRVSAVSTIREFGSVPCERCEYDMGVWFSTV